MMAESAVKIQVRVELFGVPRLRAGCRQVMLALSSTVTTIEVVSRLAETCPSLIGTVIRDDLQGLKEGYIFNLNGVTFLKGESFNLRPGDSLLLLSNQAGG